MGSVNRSSCETRVHRERKRKPFLWFYVKAPNLELHMAVKLK